jgi:hypothetical protein
MHRSTTHWLLKIVLCVSLVLAGAYVVGIDLERGFSAFVGDVMRRIG